MKSDLLITGRRGENGAFSAHPAGDPDGLFPPSVISCKGLWLKGSGRSPHRGRGFGWVPFPFPHQTTMQPSETFCGRVPFSLSHSPAARPAEMISVADMTPYVWRREATGAQRRPNTERSTTVVFCPSFWPFFSSWSRPNCLELQFKLKHIYFFLDSFHRGPCRMGDFYRKGY